MVAAMDTTTASAFDPEWVQNHQETELWSGPMLTRCLWAVPQWSYFQAIGPQPDSRLYVWNPQTNNYAFICAAGAPVRAPPTATPTPPYTNNYLGKSRPYLQVTRTGGANFVETTLWSTPGPDAEPIWEVPQFRRFMVVAEQQGDKLKVWSPER